ncbi:MAG: UDP-3-O-(3-hydroxymyristoyl)glucosamine N-acyltransferase [Burkholderiales bacterium]|jgi:UDP-3-O-[3-hydroxymyristoyl] glucosamine N-acyltransferase|nr:UDP-3-O-(3-hydroxymyristoyl)glucosamine N-acyltransferase [Burkholderiales bacterium]
MTQPFRARQAWRLADLAVSIGATLDGDGETLITGAASLDRAQTGDIAFLSDLKYRKYLEQTQASAVILSKEESQAWADESKIPRLIARNPYAAYAKAANCLYREPVPQGSVHPTAVIAASAQVSADAVIGAYVVVGERAVIDARAVIDSGVIIGDDARVGVEARIYPNVVIYPRCEIGARTILHGGCVIGADGFGFAFDAGQWVKIPQIGRVLIGDDVEIGANTTIDRGALGDTVVENDVKIDNQVQIGHNCLIGEHAAIVACSGIAGSSSIGRYCRIGGAAMIGGHLSIADYVTIGAASPVFSSVEEVGVYSGIYPLLPHRQWQKNAVQLRQIDTLYKRVRALERELDKRKDDSDSSSDGSIL